MQSQTAGRVQILLTLAILVAVTYLIGVTWSFVSQFLGTFMLFFFAWLLATLLKPLVVKMTGAGLPFGLAVLLVYIIGPPIALVVGYLLVSNVAEQVAQINSHLDQYTSTLSGLAGSLKGVLTTFGVSASDLQAFEDSVRDSARSAGQAALSGAVNTLGGIGDALFRILLVLIFSISFVVEGDQMASQALATMPERWRAGATLIVKTIEQSFGSFVRGQLFSALAYALLTAVVMLAFGLPNVAVASLAAGLFMIVPLVGNYLAYIPPVLSCLAARPDQTLIVLIVVVIAQGIYMNFVSPHIIARAVTIHPLVAIGSILVFGQLGGFWGAFFAIPIAASIGTLARPTLHALQSYLNPTSDPQSPAQSGPSPAMVPQANAAHGDHH